MHGENGPIFQRVTSGHDRCNITQNAERTVCWSPCAQRITEQLWHAYSVAPCVEKFLALRVLLRPKSCKPEGILLIQYDSLTV